VRTVTGRGALIGGENSQYTNVVRCVGHAGQDTLYVDGKKVGEGRVGRTYALFYVGRDAAPHNRDGRSMQPQCGWLEPRPAW
jgi:hypothetical protein